MEPSSGEEDEREKIMCKIVAEQMKAERSPAKGRSSALRDDHEAPEEAEKLSHEHQAKTIGKKPTGNECFQFVKTGSCCRGSSCKFEHQERGAPSPYPQNPKRSRQESPPPERRQR